MPSSSEAPEVGTLTFIDNAVDTTTGTIHLRATFENSRASLWPGLYVNTLMTLAQQSNAKVVPVQAITAGQQGAFVYVVQADATVGGAVRTTADVLRAALWAVGPAAGITTVSSAMYMVTDAGVITFTDAGVVQYPTAAQWANGMVPGSLYNSPYHPRNGFVNRGGAGTKW